MKISVYVFDDDCFSASQYFDSLAELMPDEVLAIKQSEPQLNRRFYELINLGGDSDQIDVTFSLSVNEAKIKEEIAAINDFGDLILIDDNYEEIDSMFGQRVILPTLVESIRTPLRLLPVCCLWTLHWKNDVNRRRTFASFLDKEKTRDRIIMGLGKDDPNGLLQAIRWVANLKRLAQIEADRAASARVAGLHSKKGTLRPGNIVGKSAAMATVFELIEKFAPSDEPVIILGANGTGKENVARNIHNASPRKSQPFIAIDAGTLSNNLGAPELFGHAKGAFTGATESKPGLLEEVGSGTLFIDEIGNLSFDVQKNLLRVLQEREFGRIGDRANLKKFHGRIISATNADLEQLVSDGTFRSDLYYRISVLDIHLPTLAERGKEEIMLLGQHFVSKLSAEKSTVFSIDDDAMDALCRYHWPGNVRELENKIKRATTLATDSGVLTLAEFSGLEGENQQRTASSHRNGGTVVGSHDSLNTCRHYPVMLANLLSVAKYATERGNLRSATNEEVGLFVVDDRARAQGNQPKSSRARGKALGQHIREYPEDYAKLLVSSAEKTTADVISFFLRWTEVNQHYERVRSGGE